MCHNEHKHMDEKHVREKWNKINDWSKKKVHHNADMKC